MDDRPTLHDVASLAATPNPLWIHYTRFRVSDRLLLTGHSHQAWPDCAAAGVALAFDDAAAFVDDKWEKAFEQAALVRGGYARLLNDEAGHIALGANTHELVVRFLSALPLRDKPRLVTTDGEFHSIRRQLDRLSEEGVEVDRVSANPVETLAERLATRMDVHASGTAAVLVSSVLFQSARIVPGLGTLAAACDRHGVPLLVDMYHQLNVVPMSLCNAGLARAYVVGGGYKYCQLGEGNAFLRLPSDSTLRPVVTGWFSEFSLLGDPRSLGIVRYGIGPDRFAGATYDPSSHYRAAAVFGFFERQGLTPELLRRVSQHQVGLLAARFDALDLDPAVIRRDSSVPIESVGGFLALQSPHAGALQDALRERDVLVDHRGNVLRLGPAPYVSDQQLCESVDALGEAVRAMS
jgi:kynureninase